MAGEDKTVGSKTTLLNSEVTSLSALAAGEVDNAMADAIVMDDPPLGAQQGQDRTQRGEHNADARQEPKTIRANRHMTESGSPAQGAR